MASPADPAPKRQAGLHSALAFMHRKQEPFSQGGPPELMPSHSLSPRITAVQHRPSSPVDC